MDRAAGITDKLLENWHVKAIPSKPMDDLDDFFDEPLLIFREFTHREAGKRPPTPLDRDVSLARGLGQQCLLTLLAVQRVEHFIGPLGLI